MDGHTSRKFVILTSRRGDSDHARGSSSKGSNSRAHGYFSLKLNA